MGAKPLAAFLSLALPREMVRTAKGRKWLDGYLDGLQALAERHGVTLAGGDTAESPSAHVLADIVLLGTAPRGRALRRSGARAGDAIYATGSLGGAAAELERLLAKPTTRVAPGAHPQLFPEPRLAVGQALLRRRLATACIDLSDGLSSDLTHLCQASGLRAEILEAALPLGARLELGLHGGEDYELLFTTSETAKVPRSIAGVRITRIGTMLRAETGEPVVRLVGVDGRAEAVEAGGWEHFG
jgi:thiamine-monophosphate kinase